MPADLTTQLAGFLSVIYAGNLTSNASNQPTVLHAVGSVTAPSVSFAGATTTGVWQDGTSVEVTIGGVNIARFLNPDTRWVSTGVVGWASGDPSTTATDTGLARNAAGVVEANNGTKGTLRDLIARGITANGATTGLGYATGAGGTVIQATSKATAFTLNAVCGTITFAGDALAGDTSVSSTWTNSAIAATDNICFLHVFGGTGATYALAAVPAAGSATVVLRNITPGSLTEAPQFRFSVIKGVNA